MNTITKILATVSLSTFAVFSFATTTKITVNGMVCAFCAQGIEKRLSKLPATKAVYVDLKEKIVAVEAKDGMKLDEKTVRAEITDAGYDVVKTETISKTVAQFKADAVKETKK